MLYLLSLLSSVKKYWRESIILFLLLSLLISLMSFNAKSERYKRNLEQYKTQLATTEAEYSKALLSSQNKTIESVNNITTKYLELKEKYETQQKNIIVERKSLNNSINSLSEQITNIRNRNNPNQGGDSASTSSVSGGANTTMSKDLSNMSDAFTMCISEYGNVAEISDKLTNSVKIQDEAYRKLIETYNTK